MNTGFKALLAVAGVAGVMAAGVAVAQVPPGGPGAPPPPGEMQRGEMQRGGEEMHGEMHGRGGWMHRMMEHRMPPPSKAAQFRFRKGDAMVDIKCAEDEPTTACVDAGSALLDKLMAAPK